jgi:hypothetical protein
MSSVILSSAILLNVVAPKTWSLSKRPWTIVIQMKGKNEASSDREEAKTNLENWFLLWRHDI